MTDRQRKLLLFGGSGQIGQSIAGKFREKGWEVIIVSRSEKSNSAHEIQWDVDVEKENVVPPALHNFGLFDSVCWAQGVNLN
jgi:prephenate dehydrogenase